MSQADEVRGRETDSQTDRQTAYRVPTKGPYNKEAGPLSHAKLISSKHTSM